MTGRVLALCMVCMAGTALRAQNYAHVSGLIVDDSSAAVPGAMVTVVNEDTGFRRVTWSQQDGGYVVSSLQAGAYKITVRKDGFRAMVRLGIQLNPSRLARADFKLVIGSVQETITVEGSAPLLASEGASVGSLITRDEIEHLPLNGRGLLGLLELAPGVIITPATRGEAGQFTAAGQRPNNNYFTVDGVSANSGVGGGGLPAQSNGAALPGMTAFGSLDGLASRDAVEELRVDTSSTGPEFGRLPGAQVSLSSRSGSNDPHGSLSHTLRNEIMDANDWFANQHGDPRSALRLQDSTATLGGPLLRNRTFFFVSYEGMRLSQPFIWRQPAPTAEARENAASWVQPVLKLFPAPNGKELGNGLAEWTGRTSRPSRLDMGSARLDHAITPRLTAFARYSESPSSTEFGSDSVNRLDVRSRSVTAGLNLRPTADLTVDLRANASRVESNSNWRPADPNAPPACYQFPGSSSSCNSLVRLSISGVGQVVSGPEGQRRQTQFQIVQTAGWNRGTHSVQFGGDYVRLTPVRRDSGNTASVIASSLQDLEDNGFWVANSPLRRTSAVMKELSLFAQDTWRPAPRLTVTYGLRWEISPAPLPGQKVNFLDLSTGAVDSIERPIWRSTYANLAPRAGLAFRLTKDGRTVLRAGGGLYLDSNLSLATDLVNDGPLNVSQYGTQRHAPFSAALIFGFVPDLRLPSVKQWNASIEHAFGDQDVLSVGYAGSAGRDLIRREIGGFGSTATDWFAAATNHGSARYHSLQAQYRRRFARGLQALVSYAWSHSIDNSSTDAGLYWAGSGLTVNRDRASSDFDVRQALTAGFTYDITPAVRAGIFRRWTFDGMLHSRSGFPITLLSAEQFTGVSFENVFRPNQLSGQPVWIADSSAPGGRRINGSAFRAAPDSVQGNLGRNALNGLGMFQADLALRRDFFVRERRSMQLRIEASNAFNHPNFADPVRFLSSPLFGQSGSMLNLMLGTGSPGSGLTPMFQSGGARSLEITVRFRF